MADFDLEVFNLVKKIEINISKKLGMLSPGGYQSAWRGQGLSFAEVREYSYGDDIKDIDWNVMARMGQPFVKIFSEERESNILLVADNSASMDFGLPQRPKKHLLWEITALISLLAVRNNDKIGMISFGGEKKLLFPPARGKKAFYKLLHGLVGNASDYYSQNKFSEDEIVRYLSSVKKRSIVFFISDFLFPFDIKKWRWLTKRHETFWFHIIDPLEEGIDSSLSLEIIDLETGQGKILGKGTFTEMIAHEVNDFFQDQFHRGKYLKLSTMDLFNKKILQFFHRRRWHAGK